MRFMDPQQRQISMMSDAFPRRVTAMLGATVLGLGLLAPATAVFAQGTAPAPAVNSTAPSPQPTTPSTPASRESRINARIAQLRTELKITPAQAAKWNTVAAIMRENESSLVKLIAVRNKETATMSAVANLRNYQEIADAHAAAMKKLVPAFTRLYDAMSPAQKKNADLVFRQRAEAHAAHKAQTKPSKG
jgi:protein CpxP